MSDAACLLFYTEGTAVVQKYWFFPLYGDRHCQPKQADLGRAPTTIPHPTNQMNPTGKAGARNANVHFTGCPCAFCFANASPPSAGPQSAPCDGAVEAGCLECARVHLCVCVQMHTHKALFILFNWEITRRVSGRGCGYLCLLCLRRQEEIVYFLFLHIKDRISVCGPLKTFWIFLFFSGGGQVSFLLFLYPKSPGDRWAVGKRHQQRSPFIHMWFSEKLFPGKTT